MNARVAPLNFISFFSFGRPCRIVYRNIQLAAFHAQDNALDRIVFRHTHEKGIGQRGQYGVGNNRIRIACAAVHFGTAASDLRVTAFRAYRQLSLSVRKWPACC